MASNLILQWTDQQGQPQEIELTDGSITLGRAHENDIVLTGPMVSRQHARITTAAGRATIEDLKSRNGTLVNDERITAVELRPGDSLSVGGVTMTVAGAGGPDQEATVAGTILLDLAEVPAARPAAREEPPADPSRTVIVRAPSALDAPASAAPPGLVSEEMLARPVISERELAAAGVPVQVVELAALGGGIGSFVLVDLLRCSGMAAADIAVIGNEAAPMARYARLCQNSQIPLYERLRSNSDSTPDNPWGFPGYAMREGVRELVHGHLRLAGSIFWSVFGEPAVAQTYTPRLGDVVKSVEAEAVRIGWPGMLQFGRIRAIRKSEEGRLLAIVSTGTAQERKHVVISAKVLHLAVGYPAIQMLPDLAQFREQHEDFSRVVNAYEDHAHIYQSLREKGGVVLLRGRGIVASRIIQRLSEERRTNDKIHCIHLNRSRAVDGHHWGRARRKVEEQFEFQPFNWPKACWGGELRRTLEKASWDERKALLDSWGGTTTAARSDWRAIVKSGVREGWFRPEFGTVTSVTPTPDGRIATAIASTLAGGGELDVVADWVIDCTGLVAAPQRSPLLGDLIKMYDVPLNPVGRFAVSNDFEIEAMRHGDARLYASGAATLGGPMAAVDSFLGLQYAALKAADGMASARLKGHGRLNGWRSAAAWWRWARKAAP
ncbi:MAG: FHA domain-containing protein [Dehalococcoidia bacterium]